MDGMGKMGWSLGCVRHSESGLLDLAHQSTHSVSISSIRIASSKNSGSKFQKAGSHDSRNLRNSSLITQILCLNHSRPSSSWSRISEEARSPPRKYEHSESSMMQSRISIRSSSHSRVNEYISSVDLRIYFYGDSLLSKIYQSYKSISMGVSSRSEYTMIALDIMHSRSSRSVHSLRNSSTIRKNMKPMDPMRYFSNEKTHSNLDSSQRAYRYVHSSVHVVSYDSTGGMMDLISIFWRWIRSQDSRAAHSYRRCGKRQEKVRGNLWRCLNTKNHNS